MVAQNQIIAAHWGLPPPGGSAAPFCPNDSRWVNADAAYHV